MGTLEGVSGCFQSFIISAKALNPEFWVAVGKERMAYPTDHIHRKAVLNKSSNFQNLKIMNTPPHPPTHTHIHTTQNPCVGASTCASTPAILPQALVPGH